MLPFKVAILDYAINHKDEILSSDNIMNGMKNSVYAKETQFSKARIETYCDEFAQCGFFIKNSAEVQNDGNLSITYKITDYAISRGNRFIPGRSK